MTKIRIGTRGSPLALAQANMVAAALHSQAGVDPDDTEIVIIKVIGDQILDRSLAEVGGKGLFVKEIQTALIENRIDCAVHSAKDLETILPAPLTLGAFLPREDVRDAFIGRGGVMFKDLPQGAVVGTASLRRQALVKRARPDLRCEVLRGNVQTRLAKLEAGDCDATLLALAGLKRLGNEAVATEIMGIDIFPPALAQGAIAIEMRRDDDRMIEALDKLNHPDTEVAVSAERGFLAALDGSCRTPIAGLGTVDGDRIALSAMVALPDGSRVESIEGAASRADAAEMGFETGKMLRERIGEFFFDGWL
ncbi:hydroxymethylbilane synthase [Acuticoccus sp. MNP-M23]|nr:hydroxymethylbilane synthase [Acuticoccus sp. MNP-M23]WMS41549.1 hydroxymethylbilane synthase [Acuticoccus sp. MNP-M23]